MKTIILQLAAVDIKTRISKSIRTERKLVWLVALPRGQLQGLLSITARNLYK